MIIGIGTELTSLRASEPLDPIVWDLSAAVYDNVSFSVGSQDGEPRDVYITTNGITMYVIAKNGDKIYQYTLSAPWDISTASYDSKFLSFNSQDGEPQDMWFKPDGTKVYLVGNSSDKVYQYTMSTAWDISTASYDSINFSVRNEAGLPTGLYFKSDGTKMYVGNWNNDRISQYSLSAEWDISTASFDSKYIATAPQDSALQSFYITPDGKTLFTLGGNSDDVFQYSMSTPWDISTAIYEGISFSISAQDSLVEGLFFRNDGTKMYVIGNSSNKIYQYSL
jgi:6-phosphogluconolactonase (cycloisomerase 2 family)